VADLFVAEPAVSELCVAEPAVSELCATESFVAEPLTADGSSVTAQVTSWTWIATPRGARSPQATPSTRLRRSQRSDPVVNRTCVRK